MDFQQYKSSFNFFLQKPKQSEMELTSTIFVAEVGESPDVSQSDTEADAGEQEVELSRPCLSLRRYFILLVSLGHDLQKTSLKLPKLSVLFQIVQIHLMWQNHKWVPRSAFNKRKIIAFHL